MALVVFLRGVNVGGHKTLRPSVLASKLKAFDVTSVGAAGTFIVRRAPTAAAARDAFRKHLPFDATMMVCTAAELAELVRADPLRAHPLGAGLTGYVSVLERRPSRSAKLPIRQPDGEGWQVALIALRGRFAVSLHRRQGRTLVYPNEVVERRLGLAATTRNWSTILKLHAGLTPAR
jgi:uncharacterized protein (DUF1697 family)